MFTEFFGKVMFSLSEANYSEDSGSVWKRFENSVGFDFLFCNHAKQHLCFVIQHIDMMFAIYLPSEVSEPQKSKARVKRTISL